MNMHNRERLEDLGYIHAKLENILDHPLFQMYEEREKDFLAWLAYLSEERREEFLKVIPYHITSLREELVKMWAVSRGNKES